MNFIEQIVENDIKNGVNDGRIQTRFPPEPNGYLHIGHAKAICMDFGIAERYGGVCNLRFDDTNPVKEDVEYVDSIMEDIKWLGYKWGNVYYASDYFQQLWDLAVKMIKEGKAYVDEQTAEEIAAQKGTPTTPGTESPYRNRPIEENLDLFMKMSRGEVEEGKMVLRAKIDMANPNMHFRDPNMYRVITSHPHHRTGDKWKVYPLYDFAHGQSDYFEGVTHSICTLEFVPHNPLYQWFLDQVATDSYRPHQYEFNRLNITYTVMSKRKMLALVKEGAVAGWDDPRMPTVCGLRRRGYTPAALHDFIDRIGYTKVEGMIDVGLLEHACREDLKRSTVRVMAIMNPIKLIIDNYEPGHEQLSLVNNPDNEELGSRTLTFGPELFIERDDYMENAPSKFFRLSEGREVRLKGAGIVRCTGADKDAEGNVVAVHCELLPNTFTGEEDCNHKVKATINWIEVNSAIDAEVRLYDRLFTEENPAAYEGDFHDLLNPDSLKIASCKVEHYLKGVKPLDHFQFQKIGYFTVDKDSTDEKLVFNRTVSLKDNNYK